MSGDKGQKDNGGDMPRKLNYRRTKLNIFFFQKQGLVSCYFFLLLIYLATLSRTEGFYTVSETFFFVHQSHCRGCYGRHIEGALKLINCKVYPHIPNCSAIKVTCVQLMMDCTG